MTNLSEQMEAASFSCEHHGSAGRLLPLPTALVILAEAEGGERTYPARVNELAAQIEQIQANVAARSDYNQPERKVLSVALDLVDAVREAESVLSNPAALHVHILRTWGREQIRSIALHLLGDEAQRAEAEGGGWRTELAIQVRSLLLHQGNVCPCGAWIGQIETRPHVPGCQIKELLSVLPAPPQQPAQGEDGE